ncbi:DUF4249 domain-containing protein [Cryomorphaceae bacterium 1068]|nr:DUF4249 domain-containing protein [Cryomorphaceae bacterium 1068]
MEFSVLRRFWHIAILVTLFSSCEKDIEIDIPPSEPQIVVEGTIENGGPPIVLVSRTRGFFEPTSPADIANSYISDATVFVNDQELTAVCAEDVPPELLSAFAELIGVSPDDLDDLPLCGYIGLDIVGEFETSYDLRVELDDQVLRATTHIPNPVVPDSSYFRLWANSPQYGYVFSRFTDPDTLNNAYRVFTRRIGPNNNDNPVDEVYYAPLGSTFLDEFFNGTSLEVGFQRGQPFNSSRPTDTEEEDGFFELGDRFVFKFCSISEPSYQFYRTFEQQLGTNGSPFAAPNNVITNIEGGLGIWAGYACSYDTIFATP